MRSTILLAALAVLVLAGCTPTTTVTPQVSTEQVAAMPYEEAFRQVTTAINTQSYPSDAGGWVITSSDQVGGFISAELNGRRFVVFSGQVPYRAFVSVALVRKSDNETSVNISLNAEDEAKKLAESIRTTLGL